MFLEVWYKVNKFQFENLLAKLFTLTKGKTYNINVVGQTTHVIQTVANQQGN